MKKFISALSIIGLFSIAQPALSDSITDTYTTGDTLTATTLNNIKSAVNGNDSKISTNAANISTNASSIENISLTPGPQGIQGEPGPAGFSPSVECTGLSFVQTIDNLGNVTCSTNLLGTGYSRRFPVILDNLVTLEIAGVIINDPVLIISGIGWDTERIPGFGGTGLPADNPGLTIEHDFVIEAEGADAASLVSYFDNNLINFQAMSVIVKNAVGTETFRINLFEYDHFSYVDSTDGRTRFTFVQSQSADTVNHIQLDLADPFESSASNNLATDTLTEIAGVTHANFYPQVEIDEANRTMALTYSIVEGAGIAAWVNTVRSGVADKRAASVIQEESGVEVSRENYFGIFPISWELFDGFGLHDKIKARLVLSFDVHEPG
jgi:hypothetical protein